MSSVYAGYVKDALEVDSVKLAMKEITITKGDHTVVINIMENGQLNATILGYGELSNAELHKRFCKVMEASST